MRKVLALLLSVVMALSLMVTTAWADPVEQDLAGKTVILHTNDVHGEIARYAKVAALKAELEARGADVILVDAGDYSQGTIYVSVNKGADAVTMMNAAGYDLATIGNHEFDYGYEQLMLNMAKANFQVLCANVSKDGKSIFDANTIIEKGGMKIGFFGLETPEAQTKANPALIQGLTFLGAEDMYAAAQAQVDDLKARGADAVICLAHLGVDSSSEPNTSYDLLKNVPDIDFVIDGHSHSVMQAGAAKLQTGVDKDGNPTYIDNPHYELPIQSTGTKLAYVGVLIIDNKTKLPVGLGMLDLGQYEYEDAKVTAAAKAIMEPIDAEYSAVFAKSEVDDKEPGNRTQETNLGNLITDAMMWAIKTKAPGVDMTNAVALTNGGGIRAWIHAGDISKADVTTVLPFGNTLAVVHVKGSELLEALEASTFCTPISLGGFPQTAGMKLTVDCTKPYDKADDTYPGSTYYGPKSINRVVIDSINGKAFKADDTYAVVTNNFVADGGDTYYAFAASTAQFDTGIPLDEAVMEYVTKELKGVIGTQYAAPQGRILLNPFKDVKVSSWFGQYVIDLYNDGIINGTSATTYAPNDTLTWAAALKLLLVSHGDLKAADATGADWSKNAIAKAAELGLVAADLDGAKAISRLEFCQVAAKLNKLAESKTESKFTDCADGYVMALVDAEVINGMTETTFEPAASLTRAQIAKILYQLTLIEK